MPKRTSPITARVVTALLLMSASSGPLMADDSVNLAWHQYMYACATMVESSQDVGMFAREINALREDAHTHQCYDYDPEYVDQRCDGILAEIQRFTEKAEHSLRRWRDLVPKCEEARRNYSDVLLDRITNVLLGPQPEVAVPVPAPTEPQSETGVEIPPTTDQPNAEDGYIWAGRWELASTHPTLWLNRGEPLVVRQEIEIVSDESGALSVIYGNGRARTNAVVDDNTIEYQMTSTDGKSISVSLTITDGACAGSLVSQGTDNRAVHWGTTCRRM